METFENCSDIISLKFADFCGHDDRLVSGRIGWYRSVSKES